MTRTEFNHHDEKVFYRKLLALLHPEGLACPRCGSRQFKQVTSDYATSVPAYWCSNCRRCFDAWTGTLLQGACCPASEVLSRTLAACWTASPGAAFGSPGWSAEIPLSAPGTE